MGDAAAPSMDLFFSELSAAVLRKRQADGFSAGAWCGGALRLLAVPALGKGKWNRGLAWIQGS